ncbi:MAG: methyltransferase domain-containing protein [Pseudomonadota bacterium]
MAKVGDIIDVENADWSFGGKVAENFDQHANRSIPQYALGHDIVTALSDFFIHDGSVSYDLGCSTGSLLHKLASRHSQRHARFVGVDQEPDMASRAKERCAVVPHVEVLCDDILDVDFSAADFIVAYYTLQFVKPKHRQALVSKLYEALNWGGALVIFDKVRAPDARFQDIASAIYQDYKLDSGYSGNEIVAKARSLKGVLEPFSTAGNLALFERAGFVDVTSVYKFICFEGFLAIK